MENHWDVSRCSFYLKDGKLMVVGRSAIKVIRKAQVPVVPIYFMQKKSVILFTF
jgi:hypothetical protein